jgi:DNA-binding SARP family transcriptional activator/streptogramin lyase
VLLTLLLLRAGEVVSRDKLIDQLWGENPPRTAVGSLQNFVSELRRKLGKDVVRTHATGYSLEIEPECLDLYSFRQLLDDARARSELEERSRLLAEALALWRGPPLADFSFEPFAQAEISRLEELRTTAREERADAELKLGRHAQIVPELEVLVSENPLRERPRAQLMLALYRSGRQSEALAVYQDARRALTDELGLEPGEELQQLERAILMHNPALQAGPTGEPALRAGRTDANTSSPQAVNVEGWRPRLLGSDWRRLALLATLAIALIVGTAIALAPGSDGTIAPDSLAVVDSQTNQLLESVPVGRRPTAVAYGEGGVWVANGDDGTVSRIEPASRKVVSVIRVGADVRDLATGFGAVWVAGGNTGTLSRIDPASNQVAASLRLNVPGEDGAGPISWVAAGAGAVWATRGEDSLIRLDPITNQVVSKLQIPAPNGLAAGLGAAWLVTKTGQLLKVVPQEFESSITTIVPLYYDALAPTIGAGSVWVIVQRGTGEIWRVDPTTGSVNTIPLNARYPLDLAVAERREEAWVVDSTGALVRVNPDIELAVAKIRTTSTIHSALAVGGGSVWVAAQD